MHFYFCSDSCCSIKDVTAAQRGDRSPRCALCTPPGQGLLTVGFFCLPAALVVVTLSRIPRNQKHLEGKSADEDEMPLSGPSLALSYWAQGKNLYRVSSMEPTNNLGEQLWWLKPINLCGGLTILTVALSFGKEKNELARVILHSELGFREYLTQRSLRFIIDVPFLL